MPQTNTGWYGDINVVNQIIGSKNGRFFVFNASDATGTIAVTNQTVGAGGTYVISVSQQNRLPTMNSIITFQITQYQTDSSDYWNASITGATYTGSLWNGPAYITANTAGTNININIPLRNDT